MHALSHGRAEADQLTHAGITALKSGDSLHGRNMLVQALQADPCQEQAWLWLSGVVASDAERQFCLLRVLDINPQSAAAQRGMALLPPTLTPVSPLPSAHAPQATATPLADPLQTILAAPAVAPPTPAAPAPAPASLPASPPHTLASTFSQRDIDFVVYQLGCNRTRDEVCRMLCEQMGYAWQEANTLVVQVSCQHRKRIARRQSPFIVFLGISTLIGGIIAVIYASIWFYGAYTMLTAPDQFGMTLGEAELLLASRTRSLILMTGLFFTGLAMIIGSLLGTGQAIRSMWK